MDLYEKLDILGKAFSNGEIDALANLLHKNCNYDSDCANKRFTSAEKILDHMHSVHEAVTQDESGVDSTYSCSVVDLNSLFNNGASLDDLKGESLFDVREKGLLLFQYGAEDPVAVVFIKTDPDGYITEITLSRNHEWFDLSFYGEDKLRDSERDIPYTVKPIISYNRQITKLQTMQAHRKPEYEALDDSEVYIWRTADEYIKSWLEDNGYYVIETQTYDDCIGYRCKRKNYAYTLYMYAYGQNRTVGLDGDYCAKLLDYKFSENSTVLVVYLNVKRFKDEDEIKYSVCDYSGDEESPIELWRINKVKGKMVLEFYPRKELVDTTYRLMYAFNRDNRDVFDCIMSDNNPSFNDIKSTDIFTNDAFYSRMFSLHKECGDMKIGYVRFNDVIYSQVPYIDGYGFFSFQVDHSTDKILEVTAYPFEGKDLKVEEFIKTDEREDDNLYSNIPSAVAVEVLAPVFSERFALKLIFDNGECKKYVLPIDKETERDESVFFGGHVFTDKIWATAKIEKSKEAYRGMAVRFINQYEISVMRCYEEGTPYIEPELCGKTVYEDDKYSVEKCWRWNVNFTCEDEETGLIKVIIPDKTFNSYGISTFALKDGKRLCNIDFGYIGSFHEGLAMVKKPGYGYGFVDKNMNLVIPMIYADTDEFKNGWTQGTRNGKFMYIDKTGKEVEIPYRSKYHDAGTFNEGMCKVSTLELDFMDLEYYSEDSEITGIWGFIDESGKEIIEPQYKYAMDFCGGIAVACKGKRNNEYNSGSYWTEEELWGAVDKNGNEAIPFIFDEIKRFENTDNVFGAHYGGWENGSWGVIDNHGNWIIDPIFDDIGDEYYDGLFTFCEEDGESDDVQLGIYDIKQKRVIFEPQFYDVSFCNDGWINVEVFDEKLGRNIEKLIDRNGNDKFRSIYTFIYGWKKPYEVVIRDKNGDKRGLIDEDGNVILPCENDVPMRRISYKQGLVVFQANGCQGVKDFNGNVLIEPNYYKIHNIDNPLFIVRVGEKNNFKEGIISRTGEVVIPADFERIIWLKDNYFVCCKDGLCEMYRLIDKR